MAEHCTDCTQHVVNERQDKLIDKMEKVQSRQGTKITRLEGRVANREATNGKTTEKYDLLDKKISDSELTFEQRMEKGMKDINTKIDNRMDKMDQKMWGFMAVMVMFVLGLLFTHH